MDAQTPTLPTFRFESPSLARLRTSLSNCQSLRMKFGVFDVQGVADALSLIDSLRVNTEERQRIVAALTEARS